MDALYKRDKGICYLCDKFVARPDASRDHVNPKSKGGRNGVAYSNIRLAHETCNWFKGNEFSWVK